MRANPAAAAARSAPRSFVSSSSSRPASEFSRAALDGLSAAANLDMSMDDDLCGLRLPVPVPFP